MCASLRVFFVLASPHVKCFGTPFQAENSVWGEQSWHNGHFVPAPIPSCCRSGQRFAVRSHRAAWPKPCCSRRHPCSRETKPVLPSPVAHCTGNFSLRHRWGIHASMLLFPRASEHVHVHRVPDFQKEWLRRSGRCVAPTVERKTPPRVRREFRSMHSSPHTST